MDIRGERCDEPDGDLDEIVARNADVHLERMSDDEFVLIIDELSEKVIINFGTSGVFLNAFVYEHRKG